MAYTGRKRGLSLSESSRSGTNLGACLTSLLLAVDPLLGFWMSRVT